MGSRPEFVEIKVIALEDIRQSADNNITPVFRSKFISRSKILLFLSGKWKARQGVTTLQPRPADKNCGTRFLSGIRVSAGGVAQARAVRKSSLEFGRQALKRFCMGLGVIIMRTFICGALLVLMLANTASCGKTVLTRYGGPNTDKSAGTARVSPAQTRAMVTGAAYVRPGQTAYVMPKAAQVRRDPSRPGANSAQAAGIRNHAAKISGEAICRTLRTQIGVPYKYGGYSPRTGFDCSGLVLWAYRQYGVSTPRTAKEQARYGRGVSKDKLSPGDIVVFHIRGGYHTGVYMGNNSFVHSPKPGGNVKMESLNSRYWSKVYRGARRFI
jgi:cell wall-associated NlpC family hydrolase